ncbi:ABC transporter ATP-binding protein [Streptantibioticus cattleyicolor]|uniref:ABC-type xenobiotic transporter n=1 Tax=Streptantibioticus cattleyicolor (strain ATCC 35852 / DSM 46488 / JCM 4925 / NBRC 14057 / NRRL 8057) TaxID=1003195 RepID=F8JMP5_STREN|nr:ABC transporter ATP-binding protein [Streptantibioticus cattleyicolor]AEW98751.1 ABC transporter related protein [Streptantibioticus cattleyicolor NRRL 8057 = DSM 46488]CCB72197.1 Putative transporter ABC superfamily, ATP-binding subunit [Streptantibioticus cattleyicolor NRRL 8057 = DSM 46488]
MAVIEVEHLHKRYGDDIAVDDVSFTVEEGEIFGILGPNGAGKTTTVECLSGLRTADAGRVRVLGFDPVRDRDALRQVLGVQLQGGGLPEKLTVREALELYASFHRDPADITSLMSRLGLAWKADARYRKLSGGQQQRLAIALAMVGKPKAVVLDELTTGLDPHARRATWDLVRQVRDTGVTVVLVTHFMEEAERLCDRVAVIDSGRVVAEDTPAGLAARAGRRQRLRFRPSAPLDEASLLALPEVAEVRRDGPRIEIDGTGNLVQAVTSLLARRQIIAADLRVEQATLDDAFIALTGRPATPGD